MEESWENWDLLSEMEMDCDDDYFADKSLIEEDDEEFLRQILLQTPALSSGSESDHSLHAPEEIAAGSSLKQGNMVKSYSSNSIVSSDQQVPKKPRRSSSPKTYILSFDNSTMIPATPEPATDEGKKLLGGKGNRRGSADCATLPKNINRQGVVLQNTETEITRTNNQRGKRARTSSQTIDHILAERKRRQELTERFIALSATIPGLSKTDKASVLKSAIDYLKQLKERVDELEKQEKKKVIVMNEDTTTTTTTTTNSIIETSFEHHDDECGMSTLPEIGARAMGKEMLIEIHCERKNGVELKIMDHLENLHLSVNGNSVMPFGKSALSVTIIAQMGDGYGMSMNELVSSLRQVLAVEEVITNE